MSERNRWRRLAERLRTARIPALLVTHLPDVRYLCGFTGSSAALVVLAGTGSLRARLFTDGRYRDQARAEVQGATVTIAKGNTLHAAVVWLAAREPKLCGVDAAHTSLAAQTTMQKALRESGSTCRLRPIASPVAALREVKDDAEQQLLARAAALGCELYEGLLAFVEPGLREIDIAAELEFRARKAGAEAMSFETIVAAGARSSMPHARATTATVQPGDLLTLDFGIMLRWILLRHDPYPAGSAGRYPWEAAEAA